MYFFIITLFSLNICTISALVSRVVHLPVYLASCQPMMRAPALCCRSCPMPKPLVLPASGNFNFYRVYYTQCFFLSFFLFCGPPSYLFLLFPLHRLLLLLCRTSFVHIFYLLVRETLKSSINIIILRCLLNFLSVKLYINYHRNRKIIENHNECCGS